MLLIKSHQGTGNSQVKVPKKEMVRLNNIEITNKIVSDFLEVLYGAGEDTIEVELSNRRTSQRWGTAWFLRRRVVLYRHSAWVLIHELGHIISKWESLREKKNIKAHGREFGKYTEMLYDLWKEFIEPNLPEHKQPYEPDDHYFPEFIPAEPQRKAASSEHKNGIGVGDTVWFWGRGRQITGKVVRVNRKSCRVKPLDGSTDWRVSPSFLNLAK